MTLYYLPRPFFGYAPVGFNGGRRLPVDVREDDEAYVITAAVPGFKPADLKVEILDDVVTLSAKAETDGDDAEYLMHEVPQGEFSRSLRLPDSVDAGKAEASVENGVLTLRIPKAEEAKPKLIKINVR
jgi:HSP20 family protein